MSDESEQNNAPLAQDITEEQSFSQRPDEKMDQALRREAKKLPRIKVPKINEKRLFKFGGGGIAALMLIMMVFSCQPEEGGMTYGICSTFLELNTPYPETLRYRAVDQSTTVVWIEYTSIDPFGEYKIDRIECRFGAGPDGFARVTSISRGRRPVDKEIVDEFNRSLPAIVASNPNRILPASPRNLPVTEYWRLHEDEQDIVRPLPAP
jgi:hypothetical protein